MRLLNEKLADSQDASTSFNSTQGLLASVFGYDIQAVITGTVTGTMKLQGSCDPVPDANFKVATFPVINWTDIASSSASVTGAGIVNYNVAESFYNWVRVVYTAASGTGTITVTLNTKGF